MNFDIIPPDPMHPRVRDVIVKAIFLVVLVGGGGFMLIGVQTVFGDTPRLCDLFMLIAAWGSFYVAVKVAEDFEKKQKQIEETSLQYWFEYNDKVNSIEKAIREFPADGPEYELAQLKRELQHMQGIRARYLERRR